MSVIPSCCSKAQSFPGTALYGPVMTVDLVQVPVVAAQMPQGYLEYGDQTFCFLVEGPDKCDDLSAWTYEYLDDCHIVFDECDTLHKRTITEDEDSNEYDFEESEEHDGSEDSKWADFMDSVKDDFEDSEEQDHEDTKEHDFEDGNEDNSKDPEYSSMSSELAFGYSSSTPVSGYSSSTPAFGYSSSTPAFGYSSSTPTFGYSSPTSAEESFTFPPVVTKAVKVARQLSSGIPQSVQDALISDPNAPGSLAAQFTDGADTPDWFDDLPQQQREMFLTERAPQTGTTTMTITTGGQTTMTIISAGQTTTTTMSTSSVTTTTATTVTPTTITPTTITLGPTTTGFRYRGYDDPSCDNPSNNVTQSCIELALSSQVADQFSMIATDMSQAAESLTCSALSSAASTVAEDAASASALASAARSSLSCDNVEGNATDVNKKDAVGGINASSTVSVPELSAVFAVSFTVAVATLGLALYL